MVRTWRGLGALGAAGIIAAALAAWPSTSRPAESKASIQEIMDTVIDPSADSLWQTAGAVEEQGDVRIRTPKTPAEWKAARDLASALADGAKRLQTARPVGSNGHWVLADASTPGIRTSVQIQADIARDPTRFYWAAARLQRTAEDALAALDGKNIPAFLDAGARIDAACEACHAAYWYPRNPPRPLLSPEAFAKAATRP